MTLEIVTWCWDTESCGKGGLLMRFVVENTEIATLEGRGEIREDVDVRRI